MLRHPLSRFGIWRIPHTEDGKLKTTLDEDVLYKE